jgi:hypothetical protein
MVWSKKYAMCKICGTRSKTNRNWHAGNGLCARCYNKAYRNSHPNEFAKYGEKWYIKNKSKQIAKQRAKREQLNFGGNYSKVLERDSRKCSVCGNTKRLIVHHKDGTNSSCKDRNNSMEMLVTLCRGCHMDAHRDSLNKAKRRNLKRNDMV